MKYKKSVMSYVYFNLLANVPVLQTRKNKNIWLINRYMNTTIKRTNTNNGVKLCSLRCQMESPKLFTLRLMNVYFLLKCKHLNPRRLRGVARGIFKEVNKHRFNNYLCVKFQPIRINVFAFTGHSR